MNNNKFLEDSVLNLSNKIDDGFNSMHEKFTEINSRLIKVELAVTDHTMQDTAAQTRVDKLSKRVFKLEKPYKWIKWTLAGLTASAIFGAAAVQIFKFFFKI